ncbi:MAG: amino acid adenylation domain-containing protein [Bacteroidales bacterium]|nr:amino acid adenylation domain-containing protein [Bacteroidales bacterium]
MFGTYVLSEIVESINAFSFRNSFFINERFFTYKDLATSISRIRKELRKISFEGKIIGLITNDDLDTYASILALWLEGFAYVPLHPGHPVERGLEIINQAGLQIIIDSSENPVYNVCQVISCKCQGNVELNLSPKQVDENELAYILFTSGSTGKPKGVPISRKNLGSFMKAFWETGIRIDENDRCLQCFDLTFDVSVQSFLVPLTKGACVYTIPHDQIKPTYAHALLEDHKLTFGAMAPSMVRFLKPYFDEIELPELRYQILTAEASTLELIEEWSKCIPNADIFDFYGPTEATIYCTCSKFNREGNNKQLNGLFTIGKPLNGITAIITDEKRNIVPVNHKGELCVSGDQVTTGYWTNTEKNRESFFEKEIGGAVKRFYRTGDLCYYDEDGDIMYSGRIDFQVKIQGYRIELGEIEHHARACVVGKNVAAVAFENRSGNNEIALFIEGEIGDIREVESYLKSRLPYYMIPSKIIIKEVFPLNKNDKLDRNALKNSIII